MGTVKQTGHDRAFDAWQHNRAQRWAREESAHAASQFIDGQCVEIEPTPQIEPPPTEA